MKNKGFSEIMIAGVLDSPVLVLFSSVTSGSGNPAFAIVCTMYLLRIAVGLACNACSAEAKNPVNFSFSGNQLMVWPVFSFFQDG
jgi:hypothetical protein